ncbi:hypothetical protein GCM10010365_19470 [Streptomyces poonensis]|uniref:Uncharacterized protein n=1 Tax=Streptomyces poonensis TaxID=68255 RepID=A0A918PDW6_9ACTN|nr:hypothetical protein GCM10010365_19470 [Streptomyces poonensis]GLJ90439.1 hypothetical protein GCM10017589_30420 [Streptomyces poonensis]
MLFARRAPQPVDRVQHADDVRQQFTALGAHPGAAAFTLQQIDAEFPLRIPHGPAQRGLRHVEFLGGAARRSEPRPGDRRDVFQLLYSHPRRMRRHQDRSRVSLSRLREIRWSG